MDGFFPLFSCLLIHRTEEAAGLNPSRSIGITMDGDICFKMSTYRDLGAGLVEHRNPYKVFLDYFLYQGHCFSRSTFRFDLYFMENPRLNRSKYLKIAQTTREGGLVLLCILIRGVYLLVISMTWFTKYFDCLVSTLTKT